MYSRPSASHNRDPCARSITSGEPPTARNARTGLFTPPIRMFLARSNNSLDFDFFRVSLGIESRGAPVGQILKHFIPGVVGPQSCVYRSEKRVHRKHDQLCFSQRARSLAWYVKIIEAPAR